MTVELTPDTLTVGGDPVRAKSLFTIWGSQAALLLNNQTVYAYVTGDPAITGVEANAQIRMPACRVVAISGRNYSHATDYTITLRKDGVGTAMTSGLVEVIANHFRITTGTPITFTDGQLMSVELLMASGGAGSGFRALILELEIDT